MKKEGTRSGMGSRRIRPGCSVLPLWAFLRRGLETVMKYKLVSQESCLRYLLLIRIFSNLTRVVKKVLKNLKGN